MNVLHNLARVATATTGTGTITLGAAVGGFLTFAQAGVPNAAVVTYAIQDGVNSEIGQGTYTLSGTTLSRDTVYRSTGAGNTGKITLSGSAEVFITAAAEDFSYTPGSVLFAGANGFLDQDNAGLSYDYTTDCLRPSKLSINAAGNGLLLSVGGTLTTAGGQALNFSPTLASSLMSAQYNLLSQPVFVPSGASPLVSAHGIFFAPQMGAGAVNVTTMHGVLARLDSAAGYSGVISTGNAFNVQSPTLAGGNPITVYTSYLASVITNGQGIVTGTVLNYGFKSAGITASAASGGTCWNYGVHITVPAGSGAGINRNYGLFLAGNGAGATNNYSIYSESTAPIFIGGLVHFLGSTSAFPALKRSAARLQTRLADDSAFAGFDALDLILNGATSGTLNLKAAAASGTSVVTFPNGTTDFSATGGASFVVKQNSAGAPFTVGQLNLTDTTGNLAVSRLNSGTGATADTFWRGDGAWGTPAGTGGGSGEATVNAGAIGNLVNEIVVSITGMTGILTSSQIKAWIFPKATAEHSVDEHRTENLRVDAYNIVESTGFDIALRCENGKLYGNWNVAWEWM